MPNVIGEFAWTGWDYIGEAGLSSQTYDQPRKLFQPYPALLSGAPVIDITGYQQAWAYYNRVVWHLERGPFLAVRPLDRVGQKPTRTVWRGTDAIRSWTWDGYEGVTTTVEVYADAARVELQLNGRVIGSAPATREQNYRAKFDVDYTPGELTAIAFDTDGTEIGRETLRTAGTASEIRLTIEEPELIADGDDLAYVRVEITDDSGIVKPRADRPVTVTVDGAGTLLGFGSGEPATTEQVSAATHSTFEGRAIAVVRASSSAGQITVTATADGLEPITVTLDAAEARSTLERTAR
jgi:hypothetical protein